MNASFDDIKAMLQMALADGDKDLALHYFNILEENQMASYQVNVLCDDGEEILYEDVQANSRRGAEEIAFWNAIEQAYKPAGAEVLH